VLKHEVANLADLISQCMLRSSPFEVDLVYQFAS